MEGERLRPGRGELVVWALAALCLLAIPAVSPLVRALSPKLAVTASYPHGYVFFSDFQRGLVAPGARDPWGHPWRWKPVQASEDGNWYTGDGKYYAFYSVGPDGVDAQGGGDDVLHGFDSPLLVQAVVYSDELLVLLTLLLIWHVRGPCVRSPRSPRHAVELARAAAIASLPASLSIAAVAWAQSRSWATSLQSAQPLIIPAPIAWYGSAVVLWLLIALAIRLTRPLPEPLE